MDLLIIPDPHAHPSYDNGRFRALGKFCQKEKPDTIVCLGDWADMPSLSMYDKFKRSGEGRRYQDDIAASADAAKQFLKPIRYNPRLIMTLGNHEDRIDRRTNDEPEFDGTITMADLGLDAFELTSFGESVSIGGISFSHYFSSGVAGRPISGEHVAASMCNKLHTSAVQGHSHLFNHAERTRPDGQKIFGMSAGCFSHPEYVEGWCRNTVHMWWRGVVMLRDVEDGYYDEIRAITLRRLMEKFG